MKLIATITDCTAAVLAGGTPERRSAIIDISDRLPQIVREYLRNIEWAKAAPNRHCYSQLSFAIFDDSEKEEGDESRG